MADNQVRIIGGRHRGRRLRFLPGRGLRPTPDRVRETLFNWLQADIRGARCLDLFAGSGALGLEALSRGAGSLLLVEQHRQTAQRLIENIAMLGEQARAEVVSIDALRLLASPPEKKFDVIFLDPPFSAGLLPRVCTLLEQNAWLADGALVYLEQDAHDEPITVPHSWQPHREGRAGQSSYRLLRCNILR